MLATAPPKSRRIELILRQIKSLPALPAVAAKLLSVTASDESDARDVIELIHSDPALTAKVLKLCRRADKGVRNDVVTVDRAVVLLGFNAIRNAVLSISVINLFNENDRSPGGIGQEQIEPDELFDSLGGEGFDGLGFWRHSLAVAIAAEQIAAAHPGISELNPAEAFVCGLLHDIGKLALDFVLPKSFDRVVALTELNQANIAEFERRILGIDHHTAGKRLAEQWDLPHMLQDCIWLHGSDYEALPQLDHRRMIGLVSLADLIVRLQHIGYSGNFCYQHNPARLAEQLGLEPQRVAEATKNLHEELSSRCDALGLDDEPSVELFHESLQRANQMLGRLNEALERRSRTADGQGKVLESINRFHSPADSFHSPQDALDAVVAGARDVFGDGFYALLLPTEQPGCWLVSQYNEQGQPTQSQYVEQDEPESDLSQLALNRPASLSLIGLLPWLDDHLSHLPAAAALRLLPLGVGESLLAVLMHDRQVLPPAAPLSALCSTWAAAIAAANRHDEARRIAEQLVDANRVLAEVQDKLLRSESMARLGEMAAGAAHEMNNPLAVIAGRAELLTGSLEPNSKQHDAAQTIFDQAHRLSDLITSLRLLADPPKPVLELTDVSGVLDEAIRRINNERSSRGSDTAISLQVHHQMPSIQIDPQQIVSAVMELLHNALQSSPRCSVHVSARIDSVSRHLRIEVHDDGRGMDAHTLHHATDPFFSARAAGRRLGMGLTRARCLIEQHGGSLELRTQPDSGTVASLLFPLETGQ